MKRAGKYKFFLLAVLFSARFLVSCEDVIKIDLRNAAPRIVIEASISNISDTVTIQVHRSTDYFNPSGITAVNDAEITITDSTGIVHQITKITDGIYTGSNIHSKPGDRFDLDVTDAGVKYNATATMPGLVIIESLYIDRNPDRPDEDRINILIDDPAGVANYYKIDIFRNDTLLNNGNNFILYSDKYFDGKNNCLQISGRRLDIKRFYHGDRVRVRLLNIEKPMFDYFDIQRSITDDVQMLSVSTPSNPPNNFDNGAMGYFAAWAVSEEIVVIN